MALAELALRKPPEETDAQVARREKEADRKWTARGRPPDVRAGRRTDGRQTARRHRGRGVYSQILFDHKDLSSKITNSYALEGSGRVRAPSARVYPAGAGARHAGSVVHSPGEVGQWCAILHSRPSAIAW